MKRAVVVAYVVIVPVATVLLGGAMLYAAGRTACGVARGLWRATW